MIINKEGLKKSIEGKIETFFSSYEELDAKKAREVLKKDLFFMVDNDSCYVFDKYFEDDNGDIVDITYYQHNGSTSDDEEGIENHYEYKHYFMEVHGVYIEDDYKERVIIYANNNCDRRCCSTWKILDVII
jgi:hypothetical protein